MSSRNISCVPNFYSCTNGFYRRSLHTLYSIGKSSLRLYTKWKSSWHYQSVSLTDNAINFISERGITSHKMSREKLFASPINSSGAQARIFRQKSGQYLDRWNTVSSYRQVIIASDIKQCSIHRACSHTRKIFQQPLNEWQKTHIFLHNSFVIYGYQLLGSYWRK